MQLQRACVAFEGMDVAFATVDASYRATVSRHRFHLLTDATRWSPTTCARLVWEAFRLIRSERPTIVVSTGARLDHLDCGKALRLPHDLAR